MREVQSSNFKSAWGDTFPVSAEMCGMSLHLQTVTSGKPAGELALHCNARHRQADPPPLPGISIDYAMYPW